MQFIVLTTVVFLTFGGTALAQDNTACDAACPTPCYFGSCSPAKASYERALEQCNARQLQAVVDLYRGTRSATHAEEALERLRLWSVGRIGVVPNDGTGGASSACAAVPKDICAKVSVPIGFRCTVQNGMAVLLQEATPTPVPSPPFPTSPSTPSATISQPALDFSSISSNQFYENFDGGKPTDNWSYFKRDGSNPSEIYTENGYLVNKLKETDNEAHSLLSLKHGYTDFTLTYKRFLHAANDYFHPMDRIFLKSTDGQVYAVSLRIMKNRHSASYGGNKADYNKPSIELSALNKNAKSQYVWNKGDPKSYEALSEKKFLQVKTSSLLDKWINIRFNFELSSGKILIEVIDRNVTSYTLQASELICAKLTQIEFYTYGWYTGHYTYLDDLHIVNKSIDRGEIFSALQRNQLDKSNYLDINTGRHKACSN